MPEKKKNCSARFFFDIYPVATACGSNGIFLLKDGCLYYYEYESVEDRIHREKQSLVDTGNESFDPQEVKSPVKQTLKFLSHVDFVSKRITAN